MKKAQKTPAEFLLAAREKMNDDGAHWIKGSFIRVIYGTGTCYCSVGAMQATGRGKVADEAYFALATSIQPGWAKEASLDMDDNPRIYGLDNTAKRHASMRDAAKDIIIGWNDAHGRLWRDVDRKFRAVAKRLG